MEPEEILQFQQHQAGPARLVIASLFGIAFSGGAMLRLSFGLCQATLYSSKSALLRPIVQAVNEMGDSRDRLESELRREDRLRVMGRIVAGIAHEIRNRLNSIRVTIQVLERTLRKQNILEETCQLVVAEVDRLDTLLQSLLVFRAGTPGRFQRQPLRHVIERTLALYRRKSGIAASSRN